MGVGLLRARADEHPAIEDRVRGAVEHALVPFPTDTPRLGMIDERVVIHVLAAGADVEPVQGGFAARCVELRGDAIARQRGAKAEPGRLESAMCKLSNVDSRDVERARRLLLQLAVLDPGARV